MTITKINETCEVEWTKYQGDSMSIDFTVKVKSTQTPVDISGATIRFAVGTINESTSGVVVTNGGVLGTVAIFIPDTVMDDLVVDEYDMAVELYFAGTSVRYTIFTGTLILEEDYRA